jgi:hypothetical protein
MTSGDTSGMQHGKHVGSCGSAPLTLAKEVSKGQAGPVLIATSLGAPDLVINYMR